MVGTKNQLLKFW